MYATRTRLRALLKALIAERSDSALLYIPHRTPRSAVSQLRRWVNLNSELQQRLTELHYQKGQRALTPLQHAAFVEFLGEPGE